MLELLEIQVKPWSRGEGTQRTQVEIKLKPWSRVEECGHQRWAETA